MSQNTSDYLGHEDRILIYHNVIKHNNFLWANMCNLLYIVGFDKQLFAEEAAQHGESLQELHVWSRRMF